MNTSEITNRFCIILFLISGFISCAIAIKAPFFSAPDENAHYLRSIEVANGRLINTKDETGIMIPCDEYLVIAKKYAPLAFFQENALDGSDTCLASTFNSAGTYPPTPYLASAIGLYIGSFFSTKVETKLQFGRVANAILTSLICLMSVLLVRRYRILLASMCFLPSYLWIRSSLSADAITISLCILFLAIVLNLKEKHKDINRVSFFSLLTVALLLGSSKPIYGFFCLTSLTLISNSDNKKSTLITILLGLTITFSSLFIGLLFSIFSNQELIYINVFNGADPTKQFDHIINNPLNLFIIMLKTLSANFIEFSNHLIFPTIASNQWIPQDRSIFISAIMIIFLFFSAATGGYTLNRTDRLTLLLISAFGIFAIMLPLYVTYTLVGFERVLGLQGRYFIPVFFLLLLAGTALPKKNIFLSKNIRLAISLYIPIIINTVLFISYLN